MAHKQGRELQDEELHNHSNEHGHKNGHDHGEVCGCGCGHCHHDHSSDEDEDPKKEIVKIAIGAVLTILAFAAKDAFSWPVYIHYALLIAAYLVLGWEVAFNAITASFLHRRRSC